MINNASKFIRNRGVNKTAITASRIDAIVWYVVECYQLVYKDKPKYSKSWVQTNTTLNFEDYLKMELVDSYLQKNKAVLLAKNTALADVTFNYETQKRFIDSIDGKQKPDKIDIYISRFGLQELWNDTDENIYFAIECKRIKILSDCEDYTLDTEKFATRNYSNTRLPFEGQLAFIESDKLNHKSVSTEINKRLPTRVKLKTIQLLKQVIKHSKFEGCYQSIHSKNNNSKETFEVLHLLFDYSHFVVG